MFRRFRRWLMDAMIRRNTPSVNGMPKQITVIGNPPRQHPRIVKRVERLSSTELREVADRLIREHQPALEWLADK